MRFLALVALVAGCDKVQFQKSVHFSTGSLSFAECRLLQSEDGPQRAAGPYHGGEHIWSKCQMSGAKAGADGKIDLTYRWRLVDPEGKDAIKPLEGRLNIPEPAAGSSPMLSFHLPLADGAPPGNIKLEVHVHDAIAAQDAVNVQSLTIGAATR